MDDDEITRLRNLFGGGAHRLRDQPLLPLPDASFAAWPASLSTEIQTALPAPRGDRETPQQRFVRGVLARYVWLPDTPTVTSRYDRRLAVTLYERGVDLIVVEAALLLAGTRRALREPWLAPLPRVRAIAYYLPVVAEILDNPRPPEIDYLTCLLRRLRPLAELKLARLRHQQQYGTPDADAPAIHPVRAKRRANSGSAR
jgi:hypothetical protein